MTALTLSTRTGISYSTLIPKLNGKAPIKISEARMIRDAIDPELTLDELFDVEEAG
jgi:hypothetical protein